MKKTLPIISAILILIVIGLFIFDRQVEDSEKKEKKSADSREVDRLFSDMGVLGMPHDTTPVEIDLKDLNGNDVSIADFRGKIVFLNFWATWCPPCRSEMPSMEKLHKRFKDGDFVMVAVDLQEPASVVKQFFKEFHLTFMALLDGDGQVGGRFLVRSIPTTYILGKTGKVMGMAIGPREWDSRKSIRLFEHLVGL